jgi:serine O-acetyltransferase
MLSYLKYDYIKFCHFRGRKTGLRSFLIAIISTEFHLVCLFRLYSMNIWKRNYITQYLSLISYNIVKLVFSSDIHPSASIGKGLVLGHHYGITIGPSVIAGENIVIFNDVTIGNKTIGPVDDQMPKVGSNVIICTGARVLGNIEIGENTVVGANSVVLETIQPNSVAIGNPARLKK